MTALKVEYITREDFRGPSSKYKPLEFSVLGLGDKGFFNERGRQIELTGGEAGTGRIDCNEWEEPVEVENGEEFIITGTDSGIIISGIEVLE